MGPGGLPARALLLLVSHWAVAAGGHFPVPFSETAGIEGCHCWAQGTDCRCFGDSVLQIPADLGDRVEKLSLERISLEVLRNGSLDSYSGTLRALHLNSLLKLRTIEPGVFDSLQELREISIQKSILLQSVPQGVLKGLPKLSVLRITHSGLEAVPDVHDLNPTTYIGMLDFDSNRIKELGAGSIRVKAGTLILNHNVISIIHGRAFDGSKIAEVRLRGNHKLTSMEDDAFVGLSNLSHLDLSETSLTSLPTKGLESLEVLEIRDTPTLRVFPSVYHFRFIRIAHLTYPHHCCAFQFPETHNPEEHIRCAGTDNALRADD